MENIFVTQSRWSRIGGLPGMVMTLADADHKGFCIHGPPNLLQFFYATRFYMYRRLNINVWRWLETQTYSNCH